MGAASHEQSEDCTMFISQILPKSPVPLALAVAAHCVIRSLRPRRRTIRCRPGTTGRPRQAIVEFVEAVTTEGGADFVPPEDRIATFDNDGTLWVEHPLYTQAHVRARPGEGAGAAAPGMEGPGAVQGGARRATARRWPSSARGDWAEIIARDPCRHDHRGVPEDRRATGWPRRSDPRFKRPYTELVYQPMLEVLAYLRANGFKTYIVSGGGLEFVRAYSRAGLRRPARAGGRLEHRHASTRCRTASRC